ncbi:hypothetical protein Vretimale_6794 [Volvox reticuliferus]|uniref:Uncharacterized protein n=1 Tax=Volvox reticuliferus TaxID=1737510 RepID=A0A8J4G8G3_9CHLO|nr:hypothetical protein Vretifemale_7138 [Volvox reticuliferus]GIM02055.1 hypothetical protein Vretimale_6794 [Volvox reticuliferus]
MPPPGRRLGAELLPGLSLTKALALVMGVWVACTLIMFHQHSFVAVSRFDYSDQVLSSLPIHALKLNHIAEIQTNAAQSVAFVPIEDNLRHPYALVLVANFYGSSALYLFRPNLRPNVQSLAVLQTECGHSWAVWKQEGRRWAAVSNYCSKEKQKGIVIYELEPLTGSSSQTPDWGFKAAAAIPANGSSYVMHMQLPFGPETKSVAGPGTSGSGSMASSYRASNGSSEAAVQSWKDVLAIAEYGTGHWVLYGLEYTEDKGLVVTELQRTILRGVASLTLCRTGGSGGNGVDGGTGGGHVEIFLIGLSYYDKSFATRSAVYRWDPAKRHFVVLQVLATHGAHGARCFTLRNGSPSTTTTTAAASDGGSSSGGGDDGSLFLAIANSRQGESFVANSTLWRYDPGSERFLLHQMIVTVGAHDVEYLQLPAAPQARLGTRAGRAGRSNASGGELVDVLVFANRGADQICSPSENNPLLTWVAERQRFEPAAHLAGLQCATGLATGRLAGSTLLLATGDRSENGSTSGPLTHIWRVESAGARSMRGFAGGRSGLDGGARLGEGLAAGLGLADTKRR